MVISRYLLHFGATQAASKCPQPQHGRRGLPESATEQRVSCGSARLANAKCVRSGTSRRQEMHAINRLLVFPFDLEALLLDLLAQLEDALDEGLRARRTAGHVDIHRNKGVHT